MQKAIIYADNAATTKLDQCAFEAMLPYLLDKYGNASSAHSFSRAPRATLRDARKQIACAINADESEIFFTSGGTEGNNWVIKGIHATSAGNKGIITSNIEHPSVMKACATAGRDRDSVVYISVDEQGVVQPESLKISITWLFYLYDKRNL